MDTYTLWSLCWVSLLKLHISPNIKPISQSRGSNSVLLGMKTWSSSNQASEWENKGGLSDFEHGAVIGDTGASLSIHSGLHSYQISVQ